MSVHDRSSVDELLASGVRPERSAKTSECRRTDGLHYHWHGVIVDRVGEVIGVDCVDCDEYIHGAWLRCFDGRALCGACYEDPNREFRRELTT